MTGVAKNNLGLQGSMSVSWNDVSEVNVQEVLILVELGTSSIPLGPGSSGPSLSDLELNCSPKLAFSFPHKWSFCMPHRQWPQSLPVKLGHGCVCASLFRLRIRGATSHWLPFGPQGRVSLPAPRLQASSTVPSALAFYSVIYTRRRG